MWKRVFVKHQRGSTKEEVPRKNYSYTSFNATLNLTTGVSGHKVSHHRCRPIDEVQFSIEEMFYVNRDELWEKDPIVIK